MINKSRQDAVEQANYRKSEFTDKFCKNCDFNKDGFCTLFSFDFDIGFVCDRWLKIKSKKNAILKEEINIAGSKMIKKTSLDLKIKQINEDNEFYFITGIISTPDIDFAGDIVEPNAIIKSIEEFELPKFMHQHDTFSMPLGTIDKIYRLDEKTIMEARMPKGVQQCDEAFKLAKMGAYGGLSIGFRTKDFEIKDGKTVIKEMHLMEISLVSIPCNNNAKLVSVKSLEHVEKLSEIEDILKSKGFSNKESNFLISKVKSFQSESEQDAQSESETKQLREINKSLDNILQGVN